MIEVLLMILWFLSNKQSNNWFAEVRKSCRDFISYFFCRRFGNDYKYFHCIVVFHCIDHIHHCDSTDLSLQVTSTDTDSICNALTKSVDNCCKLLDTCS